MTLLQLKQDYPILVQLKESRDIPCVSERGKCLSVVERTQTCHFLFEGVGNNGHMTLRDCNEVQVEMSIVEEYVQGIRGESRKNSELWDRCLGR
jgi:hypothetical protein